MKKAYIFAAVAIFFWSTVSTMAKLLLGTHNNFQILWASAFFSGIFLLILNIFNKNIKKLADYKLRDYIISVLIGLPGMFFYYVFYYGGAALLSASQSFIINYLWPIMSVIFACILLREKINTRKIIAIIMSFSGIVIVMSGDLAGLGDNMLWGVIFCVLAAVSYGLFTALNQKFNYDKGISMMINSFVTFIITTVINAANGDLFIPSALGTLGYVWNGVLTIGVANTAWAIALESGETAKISNLAYITPFISLVWAALILKEQMKLSYILGLAVIVAGILIQMKKSTKKHTEVE